MNRMRKTSKRRRVRAGTTLSHELINSRKPRDVIATESSCHPPTHLPCRGPVPVIGHVPMIRGRGWLFRHRKVET